MPKALLREIEAMKGHGEAEDVSASSQSEDETAPVAKRSRRGATADAATGHRVRRQDANESASEPTAEEGAENGDDPSAPVAAGRSKQRVLLCSTRGITQRHRHLMRDMQALLPHCKKDSKLDTKSELRLINELSEMRSCNNAILFEARKQQDLYLWFAKTPNGPSAKFLVSNIHTLDELKMTGNCLKGSRPLLHFDAAFVTEPYLQVLREIFTHIFAVPRGHTKSKPFVDHIIGFYFVDGRIWFRHFQIVATSRVETKESGAKEEDVELVEIGPRFVLTPIRILEGSFHGVTMYENPHYVPPAALRREAMMDKSMTYALRKKAEKSRKKREEQLKREFTALETLFDDDDGGDNSEDGYDGGNRDGDEDDDHGDRDDE